MASSTAAVRSRVCVLAGYGVGLGREVWLLLLAESSGVVLWSSNSLESRKSVVWTGDGINLARLLEWWPPRGKA